MSIISCSHELEQAPYTEIGPAECAQCAYPLTFPCVFRITAQGQGIYLHQACAHQWIRGFIRDVWTIEGMADCLSEEMKREVVS